ncbi:hypothetical protein LJC46_10060 [Desulfovibrio sp. OttesenSCG-928-G15]|nr:hypothetical protein [Desulfovibrio sp. OttesenSCG-928-G15]
MTQITPDERERMLEYFNLPYSDPCAAAQSGRDAVLHLLDALDAAEASAESWKKACADADGKYIQAIDRAKEAEAQRDWLADVLISKSYCPDMYNQCANPEDRGCVSSTVEQKKECWLIWAAAQAREGAKS